MQAGTKCFFIAFCQPEFFSGPAGNKNASRQLLIQNVANYGGQMPDKKQDFIDQSLQDLNNDGVDRRGFLK
jgi:hypothetical protein